MALGSNIKFLRNYSGLNQTEFAKLFNLTRGKVDSYERNVAKPSITTVKAIAEHYGLAIELLHSKNLNTNPGLLNSGMSVPEMNRVKYEDLLLAKDELIKEQRDIIKFLQNKLKN